MRLIDADALKEKLGDTRDGKPVFRYTEFIRMDVLEEAIDKAPTIKTFTLADIEEQYRNGLEKGLEETIRCAMCENSMKSERGCDGSCRYDEKLFERIVQAIKDNEVQRPHGEWLITGRKNVFGGFELKCSNCHNTIMVSPDRWELGENFCDICGSRNKKEGEPE